MRLFLVTAAVVATGVAGCGATTTSSSPSQDFTGEQAKVADKIGDLQDDGSRRKAADICDNVITGALKSQLAAAGSTCAQEMKKAIEDADGFDLEVTAVQISGKSATATVRSKARGKTKVTRTLKLSKGGDGWRVAGFG